MFGKTKSGHFYNKDKPLRDDSENPVTFADAYVNGDEDLKDKHNFADERIAEQEEKDRLDAIKADQDSAQKQNDNDQLRLDWLEKADNIMVDKNMDVDEKIQRLNDLFNFANDKDYIQGNDSRELMQEIAVLQQMSEAIKDSEKKSNQESKKDDDVEKAHSKGASIQEKIEDKIDQIRKKKQAEKNGKEEVKTSRRENRTTDKNTSKDHSGDNLPGKDEHIRMSYLLATAEDK
jgi:hypothetical protein